LVAGSALAHPSPAEAPEFFDDDCIVVIDKQQQTTWHLDYAVLVDDTAPEADHVALGDSKTHQFFALTGTLQQRATDHAFLAFDDATGVVKTMPTWLTAEDVMRTAAAVTPEDMTAFTAEQVSTQDILESDALLSSAVRPLVAGTARVPITGAQASAGVDWDLRDVPPGVYQIAAYIFSPPYNGWAARPGVVKVIDGADEAQPPAVTLQPVSARLFAGQGRRVRGCVDAPEGSTLEVSQRVQAEVAGAFESWIAQPVQNGAFELCLLNEGIDAVLELRVEVRTPQGLSAATQSSGELSLFSDAAACVESALLCCPPVATPDAGVEPEDASVSMEPMTPVQAIDASDREGDEPHTADAALDEGDAPLPPSSAASSASGCAVGHPRGGDHAWLALLMLALCVGLGRLQSRLWRCKRPMRSLSSWAARCSSNSSCSRDGAAERSSSSAAACMLFMITPMKRLSTTIVPSSTKLTK
jgi:hypothetical protein